MEGSDPHDRWAEDVDAGAEPIDALYGQVEARVGFLKSVTVHNYRSFRDAELEFGRLTALVGPNGAGKSNLMDIFRFIAESMNLGLYTGLERRGGLKAVRHRSVGGRPRNMELGVEFDFGSGFGGSYRFKINAEAEGTYSVAEEECETWSESQVLGRLMLRKGQIVEAPRWYRPAGVDPTLLGLPVMAGPMELYVMYWLLRQLRWCSVVPDKLRELQEPDEGKDLRPDGGNAASVLRHLPPESREEVVELLSHVVPGVTDVRTVTRGNRLTLQFTQVTKAGKLTFEALQMSDGTLRLLGILLALYQRDEPRFLAIEEPEATIHVAPLQALVEIFQARSDRTQILFTTHSSEILDSLDLESIRVVTAEDGFSRVSAVAEYSKRAVYDALFSPGELLRAGALRSAAEEL